MAPPYCWVKLACILLWKDILLCASFPQKIHLIVSCCDNAVVPCIHLQRVSVTYHTPYLVTAPWPLAVLSVYLSSTMSYWCPPLSDGLSSLCLSVNLHRLKDVPHPYLCNPAAFILPFLLPFLLPLVSLSGPFACPCAVRTHFSDPGTFLGPCWSYLPINRHLGSDRTACQNQLEYWSGLLREVAWWLYLAHLTLLATQALGCEIEAV